MLKSARWALFIVLPAVAGGCGNEQGTAADARPAAGRLTLDRGGLGAARLVDAAARATYCAVDSSLLVIAGDRAWAVAVAVRLAWPPSEPLELPIATTLQGLHSAAAALRPLGDSVGPALVALRGTVRLEAGAAASGTLDGVADEGEGQPVRLVGEFRSVSVQRVCDRTP